MRFSDLKDLLKHSSIYGIANLLQKGIGFFMIPIYTHYLSPSDYGILELMDLSIMIITMVVGMRLGSAIIRYYHHYDNEQDKQEVFSTAFITIFSLMLLVVLLLECFTKPIAGLVLGDEKYSLYFKIVFVAMGFQALANAPQSLLLARKQSVVYSVVTISTLISYLTLNILFIVVYRMGVMGMLLSMIITKFFNVSAQLIIIRKDLKWRFSLHKFKEMVRFGLPLVPAAFCMFSMHYSDRFFIRKYVGLDELGIYSLGYKFGMVLSTVISEPFFRIWNTQRYEIAKREDAGETFGRFFTYYLLVSVFAGLGLSVFSEEVIALMASSEYRGAAAVITLIVVSYIAYGAATFFNIGIEIIFQTKYLAYINFAVAALNIVTNMFFIRYWGVIGAGVSTIVSFFALAAGKMFISQRLFPIGFEYRRLLTLFGVSGAIYGLSTAVRGPLPITIGIKSLLMLFFPVILMLFRFFDDSEMAKMKEVLHRLLARVFYRKKPAGRG